MTNKSTAMHLEASFDIDQVSDQLMWRFVRFDEHGEKIHGKEAGMINFTVGEKFYVNVIAGNVNPIAGVKIINCVLITKPFIYQCGPEQPTIYAPPSPFNADKLGAIVGACVTLPAEQFKPGPADDVAKYYRKVQHWDGCLTVGGFEGRWDISFVLTVQIARADGVNELRVFSFDPEGEVSNGGVDAPELNPAECSLEPEVDPSNGGT